MESIPSLQQRRSISSTIDMNNFKRKKPPLDIDWKLLLSTDDDLDDRPPDLIITSTEKSKGGGGGGAKTEKEDLEYQMKTDGELEDMIPRIKQNILTLSDKLPDKGEKLKATLGRCVAEVERRKKVDKGDTRCEAAIQLSDQSDNGASGWKKRSDRKSFPSSKSSKVVFMELEPNQKHSRTVNAFEDDLFFIKPRQGRKMKQICQLAAAPGRRQSKLQLSSRPKPFRCPTSHLVDSKRQMISNGDKKVSHSVTSSPRHFFRDKPGSSPKTHDFEVLPSPKLRLRPLSAYRLVDEEEPMVWDTTPIAEKLDDCMKDVKVYYPSRDDQDSIEVTYKDMACLAPKACLSSTIINFYIRYLQQLTSENKRRNYHFFNTYFYNKLQKLSYREDSFLKFRKWWKCVNIFEKAYILLPIHEKAHWSLGIICFPTKEDELGPIVLHLDSLGLHDSRSIFDNIRRFVKEEWSHLRNSEDPLDLPIADEIWEDLDCRMEDKRIPVPQQRNTYDCGLFVLFYIERFIKEAPERMRKEDLSMLNKQWFHPDEASNLRVRIHNLLVQEFKIAKDKE